MEGSCNRDDTMRSTQIGSALNLTHLVEKGEEFVAVHRIMEMLPCCFPTKTPDFCGPDRVLNQTDNPLSK